MAAHRSPILATLALLLVATLAGCSGSKPYESKPWTGGPDSGEVLISPRFAVYSTLRDQGQKQAVIETLERSLVRYDQLAPLPEPDASRREAYVFGFREEWADHTRQTQGPRAALYLNIDRGGFADAGKFSTFFSGSVASMLATVRHEGFHQHLALGFKRRPPPFLEEGLATLFEQGFENGDVTKPRSNFRRLNELREGVRRQRTWPLSRLLTMHAGHVVGANDHRQVGTFYAQAWALACFVVSDPKYREKTPDLMAAYAAGRASSDPRLAFARNYGVSFEQIAADYELFVYEMIRTDAD
ncbi:MAG: DUF1570 domain-containing protein [Planctomycetota bacterium]